MGNRSLPDADENDCLLRIVNAFGDGIGDFVGFAE
jgi:hypothetical protein